MVTRGPAPSGGDGGHRPGTDVLTRAYDAMRIEGAGGHSTGLRLMAPDLGLLRLSGASFRMRLDDSGPSPDAVMVGSLSDGLLRCTRRGEDSIGPGGDFIMELPGCDGTSLLDDVDAEITMLDARLMEEMAGTAPGLPAPHFTGPTPVSAKASAQWRTTQHYVGTQAMTNPELSGQPLVLGALSRLLVATALATFPHTGLAQETGADRRAAHPRALRRAIAFAEEHAHEDIGTADLARAAHVSVRAVQLAFRRHLGTTPHVAPARDPTGAGPAGPPRGGPRDHDRDVGGRPLGLRERQHLRGPLPGHLRRAAQPDAAPLTQRSPPSRRASFSRHRCAPCA